MQISGNSITSMLDQSNRTQTSNKSSSLTSSLGKIDENSTEEELKSVIKDFESYMVEQMIKEVKKTVVNEDDQDSTMGQYKDMYMDKTIELVADELVDEVGESLTQQLYEQMKRNITSV